MSKFKTNEKAYRLLLDAQSVPMGANEEQDRSVARRVAYHAADSLAVSAFDGNFRPTKAEMRKYVRKQIRMEFGWFTVIVYTFKIIEWIQIIWNEFRTADLAEWDD